MLTGLVILDRQHGFKDSGFDPGASAAAGFSAVTEATTSHNYIRHACAALDELRIPWTVLAAGSYAARHRQALEVARGVPRVAYVACHCNAAGVVLQRPYSLVKHDVRSRHGAELAAALSAALASVAGLGPARVASLGSGDRGFSCLAGIYEGPAWTVGALFEPFFLDQPAHDRFREGKVIGEALAAGCAAWLNAPEL